MIVIDKDIVKLNFDDDTEHLKEQLALAKEEIKSLKADVEEETRRADALKAYYEEIIVDYRKHADEADKRLEDARIVIKELETVIANRMKSLADK